MLNCRLGEFGRICLKIQTTTNKTRIYHHTPFFKSLTNTKVLKKFYDFI